MKFAKLIQFLSVDVRMINWCGDGRCVNLAKHERHLLQLVSASTFGQRCCAMAASRVATPGTASWFERLVCGSTGALATRLRPGARIASLDMSPTHVSLAVSDRERGKAVPFGVLARMSSPALDARTMLPAMRRADAMELSGSLDVQALIVGVPPVTAAPFDYVRELLREGEESSEEGTTLFPGLAAVLFYSEVDAVLRAVKAQAEYSRAVSMLPLTLESRKLKRHAAAMNPKVSPEDLVANRASRARVSASEVLQAVLDDINRLAS